MNGRDKYRISAREATIAGTNYTVLALRLAEVAIAPTPDTTSGPGIRNYDCVGRQGWRLPSESESPSKRRTGDE